MEEEAARINERGDETASSIGGASKSARRDAERRNAFRHFYTVQRRTLALSKVVGGRKDKGRKDRGTQGRKGHGLTDCGPDFFPRRPRCWIVTAQQIPTDPHSAPQLPPQRSASEHASPEAKRERGQPSSHPVHASLCDVAANVQSADADLTP